MKTPLARQPAAPPSQAPTVAVTTTAATRLGDSPRMAAQRQRLGEAFGPVAQRVPIRQSDSGKYKLVGNKPPANTDIETDNLSANEIGQLLMSPLAGDVKDVLLRRLITLNTQGQLQLQSKDDSISRLGDEKKNLEQRVETATDYLKQDGEALSIGATFREHLVPLTTGALALVNGPVNAFLNTATRVDVSLATSGVATALQVANDGALVWSAQNQWRRGYLITAMVCQAAAQMLMTAPGTDDPLFQAPAQNDTLVSTNSSNTTIPGTGSYDGNKWLFLSIALLLGLLATFFRFLDARQSNSLRRRESKRRVSEVGNDNENDDLEGGNKII